MNRVPHGAHAGLALAIALVCLNAPQSQAAHGGPGVCAPPRTRIAIVSFANQTSGAWELMTGVSPARLIAARLADSLERAHGRSVVIVAAEGGSDRREPVRLCDDPAMLAAARRVQAEIVLTGVVSSFAHEDERIAGRFGRWGVGAPDARSRAEVAVSIRVLDAEDGTVILESRAARARVGRSTSSAHSADERVVADDEMIADALDQVLGDLMRTLAARLDERWEANVVAAGRNALTIDAGAARGLFTGERLEVWRPGIELLDEDLIHLGDDARVGAVVVEALEGRGRARVRLLEGEAREGDLVRPCSAGSEPAMSFRR